MQVLHIPASAPLYTNTFLLLADNGNAIAIDPAAAAQQYNEQLEKHGAKLTHIVCTHGHYDHVAAVTALREKWHAAVHLHTADRTGGRLFPLTQADCAIADAESITEGDITLQVITTPGHSAGSVCFLCGGLLFSGDTLFAGDIGRCDLDGGNYETMKASLQKLAGAVQQNAQVLPGHGEFSTMDAEKANNPYLQASFGG